MLTVVMDMLSGFVKRLGCLWYLMDPRDNMYEKVADVPDYYWELTSAFIFLITLEQGIRLFQGRGILRLNDSVTNICQGVLMELSKVPMYGVELIVYTWVYNNWRLCSLPWNSVWTWIFCMVISDFCFYWAHRAVHQISILWAFHETHHSSEDFNLTTPLRLSVFHNFSLWFTYVPLALAIPPSIYLVHFQLSVIFQFWLHTEVVKSVGFLEYIFVTPSHHRVHHGRNRRCIDKNFGSVFILWDKMFGTFEPEGKEPIVYGVTKPLRTFSPFAVQFNYFQTIWNRLCSFKGLSNKLGCLIKSPGWVPGKPWLGCIEDIPEPKENESKYDPDLPTWLKVYILLHTSAMILGHFQIIFNLSKISAFAFSFCGSYIVLTTISIGHLLDLSTYGPAMEFLRCLLYFLLDASLEGHRNQYLLLNTCMHFFRYLFILSSTFWVFVYFRSSLESSESMVNKLLSLRRLLK